MCRYASLGQGQGLGPESLRVEIAGERLELNFKAGGQHFALH
jgi:hypothetical protein